MLKQLRVVGVLGLGRNTFLPHTHQKASVLFGCKRREKVTDYKSEPVVFMISEHDGKDSRGNLILRDSDSRKQGSWNRVDHDLGEAVDIFSDFIEKKGIAWSSEE